jgi:hypothetical protein
MKHAQRRVQTRGRALDSANGSLLPTTSHFREVEPSVKRGFADRVTAVNLLGLHFLCGNENNRL